jgi:uncharacterized alkaline shock family protein YloU
MDIEMTRPGPMTFILVWFIVELYRYTQRRVTGVLMETDLGNIEITNDVIATIAGVAAVECYGLVGMASRKQLKDGIVELLGRENLSRGVEVREVEGELNIDLYIIVGYGTRIDEVANNVISTVKYSVEKYTGIKVGMININVQGVRVINGK